MASEFNKTLNIYINSGEAQKVLDKLRDKQDALKAALLQTTDPKQVKKLNAELAKLEEPIQRATKKLNGEMAPSLRDMSSLVSKLSNQLKHMSTSDADYSKVLAQYAQAKARLTEMRVEMKKVESAHQGVGKSNPFGNMAGMFKGALMAAGTLAAVGSFTDFLKGSIDEALAAEEGSARFKATLDNLGRSDAFDRIIAKADEMAQKFRYLDNDDVVGVFNKMVDYGKLTEKEMNDLLPVIINFAAKQRISLEESTSVIIKALEGNGKALKEYGINIKDAETDTERLNVVMTTLKDKVEGAAEAFQQTTAGSLAQTKQEVANLKEEIGNGLLPVLRSLLSFFNTAIQGATEFFRKIKNEVESITKGQPTGQAASDQKEQDYYAAGYKKSMEDSLKEYEKYSDELLKKQQELLKKKLLEAGAKLGQIRRSSTAKLTDVYNQKQLIGEIQGEMNAIDQLLKKTTTQTFGTGKNDTGKGDKKGTPKRDQVAEDQKKLLEIIRDAEFQRTLFEETEENKRIAQAAQKWEEHRKLAHGNRELLKQIDEQYWAEVLQIQVEYGRKSLEERLKQQREQTARLEALGTKTQRGLSSLGEALGKNDRNIAAGLEVDLMKSSGRKRLDLHLKLLEQEKKMELQNTELTQNERALIEEQYRAAALQSEQEYYQRLFENITAFISQALTVMDTFAQAKTNKENQELERDRKLNENKKKNLERQLKSKQITQMDYDRKVAEIEEEQEKKEKATKMRQFRREQRLAVAKAFISAAEGSLKTVAEWGMPLAIPFLALVAAQLIGQIALINSQKPQFARGGKLDGPSHSENKGMPVTNPRTGEVQAYLEGEEAIINKRTMRDRRVYSMTGTPSQISSTLNALHGGVSWDSPARLQPAWKTLTPQPMNYGAIRRAYADGGIYNAQGKGQTRTVVSSDPQLLAMIAENTLAISALQQQLAQGIVAYASIHQINTQQDRLNLIRQDATFTPSAVRVKSNPKVLYGYISEEPEPPAP